MSQLELIYEMLDDSDYEFEIVSYGLAPNSTGFCFECADTVSQDLQIKFSEALDSLTLKEELLLRKDIFG